MDQCKFTKCKDPKGIMYFAVWVEVYMILLLLVIHDECKGAKIPDPYLLLLSGTNAGYSQPVLLLVGRVRGDTLGALRVTTERFAEVGTGFAETGKD